MSNFLSSLLYTATRSETMAGIIGLLFFRGALGSFTVNGGDWTWLAHIVAGVLGYILFSRAWISYESRRIHAAYDRLAAETDAA